MGSLTRKPTKWVCAQQRLRSDWADAQSDQSLRYVLNEKLRTRAFFMRTAKTLIRLGGPESLLGAHAILLVLSWGGSNNIVLYLLGKALKVHGNSVTGRWNLTTSLSMHVSSWWHRTSTRLKCQSLSHISPLGSLPAISINVLWALRLSSFELVCFLEGAYRKSRLLLFVHQSVSRISDHLRRLGRTRKRCHGSNKWYIVSNILNYAWNLLYPLFKLIKLGEK